MGSFSIWHWLVVLLVVALVFGTKKLRNAGGDLGAALKNFKESIKEAEADPEPKPVSRAPASLDAVSQPPETKRQA